MLSTTKECFEFIAKNWTKEMYKKEKERYNKTRSHILSNETETSSTCYRCKTIWDNKNMVSNWHGCSQCDKTALFSNYIFFFNNLIISSLVIIL